MLTWKTIWQERVHRLLYHSATSDVQPLCVSPVRVSDVSHNLNSSCKITIRAVMISILRFPLLRSRNFPPDKFSWTDNFYFFSWFGCKQKNKTVWFKEGNQSTSYTCSETRTGTRKGSGMLQADGKGWRWKRKPLVLPLEASSMAPCAQERVQQWCQISHLL